MFAYFIILHSTKQKAHTYITYSYSYSKPITDLLTNIILQLSNNYFNSQIKKFHILTGFLINTSL